MRVRSHTLLALLIWWALVVSSGATNVFTVDGSGNITFTGGFTNTSAEVNGNVTLANDETIDNATDTDVRITYNDDDAILGSLTLESENTATNMADGDSVVIRQVSLDSAGNKTTNAVIDLEASDVTTTTEDGRIKLQTLVNNVLTTSLTLDEFGLTLQNGEIIDNTSDAVLDLKFDDNAAILGTLKLRSSQVASGLENENYIVLNFEANDSVDNETVYAAIRGLISDKTTAQEDGRLEFWTIDGATETEHLQIDQTGLTIVGDVLISDASAAGVLSVTGANATDATLILDADNSDDVMDQWILESEAADNDLSFVNATTENMKLSSNGVLTVTTSISVPDIAITDDLTVADDLAVTGLATVGETLAVTGVATFTAESVHNLGIDADYITTDISAGIDTKAAGALLIGASTATSIIIGDSGVAMTNEGSMVVSGAVTCVSDVAIDGKYAAVGEDATTPLMIEIGTSTLTADGTVTTTWTTAFGAAPTAVVGTYSAAVAATNLNVATITTTTAIWQGHQSKAFTYIAVGQRP